ncbi:hypothetical protein FB451DRAFT_1213116 [Mycena latifolia]|nr:hypothetical protein FB451DRAFT_1213116 [Mycena latifolia]
MPEEFWEDNNSAIKYSAGHWTREYSHMYHGGAVMRTRDIGASLALVFNGSAIKFMGAQGWDHGTFRVALDGVETVVDGCLYQLYEGIPQAIQFQATGLSTAPHVLKITNTAPGPHGAVLEVDAFIITPHPPPHSVSHPSVAAASYPVHEEFWEDDNPAIKYSPGHWARAYGSIYHRGAIMRTHAIGASLALGFHGSAIQFMGAQGWDHGTFRVMLDGKETLVDGCLYQIHQGIPQVIQFQATGLSTAPHVLKITNTAPGPHGSVLEVDAFIITPHPRPQSLFASHLAETHAQPLDAAQEERIAQRVAALMRSAASPLTPSETPALVPHDAQPPPYEDTPNWKAA